MTRPTSQKWRITAAAVGAVFVAGTGVAVFAPPASNRPLTAARRSAVAFSPGVANGTSRAAAAGTGGSGASSGSPSSGGSAASGASTAGPAAAAGKIAAGPVAAGQVAAGQVAAGPVSTGPVSTGTAVAGTVVGPPAVVAPVSPDTVVRTGTIEVGVLKGGFAKAFSAAADVARADGGFVVSAEMAPTVDNTTPPTVGPVPMPGGVGPATSPGSAANVTVPTGSGAPTSGTLTIRVPGNRFDDARRQLEGLGSLRQEQLSGQDAGGQLANLDAQLTDLRAEQSGLRAMAAKAPSTQDLLNIQAQLATVQQQIDGLTAQQNTLQNQVALASITVTIAEPVVATTPSRPSVLAGRLTQAGHAAQAVVGGMVVVLAAAGPIAVLVALGWLVFAGVRRRRSAGTVAPTPVS